MTALRDALALLTRIPIAAPAGRPAETTGIAAFGAAGALLGAAAALPLLVLPAAPLVGSTLAIAVLASLSGALHLDGLADTADALAAPDPVRAEAARKDPRVGAAGMVAVVLAVLLDVAALAALADAVPPAVAAMTLVAVVAASRAAVTLLVRVRAASARDGSAAWFASTVTVPAVVAALATAAAAGVLATVVAGSPVPAIGGVGAGIGGVGAGAWIVDRRRGLDGDGIGAAIELAVAIGFLAALGAAVAASAR